MRHWFEGVADHLGDAYLRYSFTCGTVSEVAALVDVLDLVPGDRVLDVGCGPGRHSHELARRGHEVVGLDVSETFIAFARRDAPRGATFSLCQGAFGLAGGPGSDTAVLDPDGAVLDRIVAAVRPGGGVALSAFSAYFQVRFLGEDDDFDVGAGVNRENTVLRDTNGVELASELWTTCFTPRELRLLADRAGLVIDEIRSVTPGDYTRRRPDLDHPEFLVVGRRAGATQS